MRAFINFCGFQALWWATVLGTSMAKPWIGPSVMMVWIVWHFTSLKRADILPELALLVITIVVGMSLDSALVSTGFIEFPLHTHDYQVPLWMGLIWAGFGMTFRHSLGWLRGRYWLAALLGVIGGPVAYVAGETFGVIVVNGTTGVVAVGFEYLVAVPALTALSLYVERLFSDSTESSLGDPAK